MGASGSETIDIHRWLLLAIQFSNFWNQESVLCIVLYCFVSQLCQKMPKFGELETEFFPMKRWNIYIYTVLYNIKSIKESDQQPEIFQMKVQ